MLDASGRGNERMTPEERVLCVPPLPSWVAQLGESTELGAVSFFLKGETEARRARSTLRVHG